MKNRYVSNANPKMSYILTLQSDTEEWVISLSLCVCIDREVAHNSAQHSIE